MPGRHIPPQPTRVGNVTGRIVSSTENQALIFAVQTGTLSVAAARAENNGAAEEANSNLMSSISKSFVFENCSSSDAASCRNVEQAKIDAEIWLVEDNEIFSTGMQRVIDRTQGMKCGGKHKSAEQAFAALDAGGRPNVILLDVQLPGMDGITALPLLKSKVPEAQVVILTVFDDADKISRAVRAGASGYILKSSCSAQISEAIMQVINDCRCHGEQRQYDKMIK